MQVQNSRETTLNNSITEIFADLSFPASSAHAADEDIFSSSLQDFLMGQLLDDRKEMEPALSMPYRQEKSFLPEISFSASLRGFLIGDDEDLSDQEDRDHGIRAECARPKSPSTDSDTSDEQRPDLVDGSVSLMPGSEAELEELSSLHDSVSDTGSEEADGVKSKPDKGKLNEASKATSLGQTICPAGTGVCASSAQNKGKPASTDEKLKSIKTKARKDAQSPRKGERAASPEKVKNPTSAQATCVSKDNTPRSPRSPRANRKEKHGNKFQSLFRSISPKGGREKLRVSDVENKSSTGRVSLLRTFSPKMIRRSSDTDPTHSSQTEVEKQPVANVEPVTTTSFVEQQGTKVSMFKSLSPKLGRQRLSTAAKERLEVENEPLAKVECKVVAQLKQLPNIAFDDATHDADSPRLKSLSPDLARQKLSSTAEKDLPLSPRLEVESELSAKVAAAAEPLKKVADTVSHACDSEKKGTVVPGVESLVNDPSSVSCIGDESQPLVRVNNTPLKLEKPYDRVSAGTRAVETPVEQPALPLDSSSSIEKPLQREDLDVPPSFSTVSVKLADTVLPQGNVESDIVEVQLPLMETRDAESTKPMIEHDVPDKVPLKSEDVSVSWSLSDAQDTRHTEHEIELHVSHKAPLKVKNAVVTPPLPEATDSPPTERGTECVAPKETPIKMEDPAAPLSLAEALDLQPTEPGTECDVPHYAQRRGDHVDVPPPVTARKNIRNEVNKSSPSSDVKVALQSPKTKHRSTWKMSDRRTKSPKSQREKHPLAMGTDEQKKPSHRHGEDHSSAHHSTEEIPIHALKILLEGVARKIRKHAKQESVRKQQNVEKSVSTPREEGRTKVPVDKASSPRKESRPNVVQEGQVDNKAAPRKESRRNHVRAGDRGSSPRKESRRDIMKDGQVDKAPLLPRKESRRDIMKDGQFEAPSLSRKESRRDIMKDGQVEKGTSPRKENRQNVTQEVIDKKTASPRKESHRNGMPEVSSGQASAHRKESRSRDVIQEGKDDKASLPRKQSRRSIIQGSQNEKTALPRKGSRRNILQEDKGDKIPSPRKESQHSTKLKANADSVPLPKKEIPLNIDPHSMVLSATSQEKCDTPLTSAYHDSLVSPQLHIASSEPRIESRQHLLQDDFDPHVICGGTSNATGVLPISAGESSRSKDWDPQRSPSKQRRGNIEKAETSGREPERNGHDTVGKTLEKCQSVRSTDSTKCHENLGNSGSKSAASDSSKRVQKSLATTLERGRQREGPEGDHHRSCSKSHCSKDSRSESYQRSTSKSHSSKGSKGSSKPCESHHALGTTTASSRHSSDSTRKKSRHGDASKKSCSAHSTATSKTVEYDFSDEPSSQSRSSGNRERSMRHESTNGSRGRSQSQRDLRPEKNGESEEALLKKHHRSQSCRSLSTRRPHSHPQADLMGTSAPPAKENPKVEATGRSHSAPPGKVSSRSHERGRLSVENGGKSGGKSHTKPTVESKSRATSTERGKMTNGKPHNSTGIDCASSTASSAKTVRQSGSSPLPEARSPPSPLPEGRSPPGKSLSSSSHNSRSRGFGLISKSLSFRDLLEWGHNSHEERTADNSSGVENDECTPRVCKSACPPVTGCTKGRGFGTVRPKSCQDLTAATAKSDVVGASVVESSSRGLLSRSGSLRKLFIK